jgi:hypothetical protein
MDYGKLLSRAWRLIGSRPFLILLGVIVALSGGSGGGASALRNSFSGSDFSQQRFGVPPGPMAAPEIAIVVLVAILVGLLIIVALALWVASTIARGGLIAGVDAIESERPTRFGVAWRAGWEKGWRLIGIGLLPAIPGLVMLIAGIVAFVMVAGLSGSAGRLLYGGPAVGGLIALAVAALCMIVPITVVLNVLRDLANRSCMLEDQGVIDSYRRAWEVMSQNLGEVIIIFLIQLAINIGIGILMIFPGCLLALCCLFWQVLLAVSGAVVTYISTMWTLAWREWTSPEPPAELVVEAAPSA